MLDALRFDDQGARARVEPFVEGTVPSAAGHAERAEIQFSLRGMR